MIDLSIAAFKFEEQMKKTKPGFNLERRPHSEIGYLSAGTQHMWQGYLLGLEDNLPDECLTPTSLRAAYNRCRQHADLQAHRINQQHAMIELYGAMSELANDMPKFSDRAQSLTVITKGIKDSLKLMRGEI